MNKLTYAQIQEFLADNDFSSLPKFNIFVMRNIMLEPIEAYIRYSAYLIGCDAKIIFGNYDNMYQDAVSGPLIKNMDCILVFLNLEAISIRLTRNLPAMKKEEIDSEVTRIKGFIAEVLMELRRNTNAMILWHSFEFPTQPAFGVIDRNMGWHSQLRIIEDLNNFLAEKTSETKNAYMVDLNICLSRIGTKNFFDKRYWYIGKAPFAREALREIVFEEYKFIRALKGKNKKCLVFDCDNTIWGGIVGEEGINEIKLSKTTYPGIIYYELQQEILNLFNRGIILAVCSKNNENDVWEVFDRHPDMILKREHIAASQINWENKIEGLIKIARGLNIGLDSLVMLDDSEFEINLIKKNLPEVETIYLNKEKTSEYPELLTSCGLFETLALTEEDKNRGKMYKAEMARRKSKTEFKDIKSYYKSLEMCLKFRHADDTTIGRIAQLTQKTNQFNLTARRYTDTDIKSLLQNKGKSDVIYLQLQDRYGDFGIIGAAILKHEVKSSIIDTFLISCRALGRGIENVFLSQLLELARISGSESVIGEYIPTRKNEQTKEFYSAHGFQVFEKKADLLRFQMPLIREIKKMPDYFKEIDSEFHKKPKELSRDCKRYSF